MKKYQGISRKYEENKYEEIWRNMQKIWRNMKELLSIYRPWDLEKFRARPARWRGARQIRVGGVGKNKAMLEYIRTLSLKKIQESDRDSSVGSDKEGPERALVHPTEVLGRGSVHFSSPQTAIISAHKNQMSDIPRGCVHFSPPQTAIISAREDQMSDSKILVGDYWILGVFASFYQF